MRSRGVVPLLIASTVALVMSACGSTTDGGTADGTSAAGDGDASPIVIEHALGTTTIEEKPERVATVAWANHVVPLALGVVPVGMDAAIFGNDDDNRTPPGLQEKLDQLDAAPPMLFDATNGNDFEPVTHTDPDVILAGYSGLPQDDDDTLSEIAPVVAYPEQQSATP